MESRSRINEAGGEWLFWAVVGLIAACVVSSIIGCGDTIIIPTGSLPGDQTQTQVIGIGIGAPVPTPAPTPTATPAPTPAQTI